MKKKEKYNLFRKAGYSAKESLKLRDMSKQKTIMYLREHKTGKRTLNKLKSLFSTEQFEITYHKNFIYEKEPKNYLSTYNYVVRYERGRRKGNKIVDRTVEYITIPAPKSNERKLTRKEILDYFWEWFDGEQDGKYNTTEVVKSSITIERAYQK